MESQRTISPDYTSTNPESVRLPDVPQHQPLQPHPHSDVTLPNLRTVLSPEYQQASSPQSSFIVPASPAASHRSSRPRDRQAQVNGTRRSADLAVASPSDAGSHMGVDNTSRRTASVLSIEDADIRDAAEALAELGRPGFARSPPGNLAHMQPHANASANAHPQNDHQETEPLLHLLTQAHPWVGAPINASLTAYSTTKGYAPRFVQASANMMERSIASPMVSTVGSVGRMTGVESVARWYLTPRQQDDVEGGDDRGARGKRRRVLHDDMDMEHGLHSPRSGMRRDSEDSKTESLPAYRASKPPSYREEMSPAGAERSRQNERPSHNRSWSSQLLYSASGLGVAMSDVSRRNLVFCLNLLGRSAEHIATVTDALKLVLEQYDEAREQWHQHRDSATEKGERPRTPEHDEAARRLAEIIKKHCDDIWQTLKGVVHSVSVTVGGALPANARNFVRNQLMSLPQRWRMVSDSQTGESETSRTANRMIAFATEGLDMIGQVSQVCRLTLESAEGWVQMVGRSRPAEQAPNGYTDYDHKMEDGHDEPSSHHSEKH
ncbi:hypothetical protein LTR85_005875 [Meristemomyces frigidus]|nr:hypothetical protein LTR85_005875 [Meristemomyces frigidus]